MKTTTIRTYDELVSIGTYLERYRYLRLGGRVGDETFGYDRWINQQFYRSREWKDLRNELIARDFGCDMACVGHEFAPSDRIVIHHMNPITVRDIANRSEYLMDPQYLICVSNDTHNAIHYGNEDFLMVPEFVVRRPNDTSPWR